MYVKSSLNRFPKFYCKRNGMNLSSEHFFKLSFDIASRGKEGQQPTNKENKTDVT